MLWLSIAVWGLGVWVSRAWIEYHRRRGIAYSPQRSWGLGLLASLPSWLIIFVALLSSFPPDVEGGPPPPLSALFSSGAGLLGVVLTDAAVRRLQASERRLALITYWILGMVSLIPAWGIAVWALLKTKAGS